ncbi:diguanylate cyclase (plasmid) [Deinococcus taeanensis]|uniref:histidine kinase N-terminal 7TM domain-containing diguanylate cyclase n=1 Tax=Deinococcus taeanensis TaxID=2737050 RepID=UPI001CDC0FC7|nr:histidine kinase N-terminal 7TM domain-containing protein [Deinococcus taeanensis]UBV44764.1 diguanylate cyclase [Deinococcus taeanensis]
MLESLRVSPTVPLLLALGLLLLMIGHGLQRVRQPVQRAFLAVLLTNCVWLLGELGYVRADAATLKWTWGLMEFFGVLTLPVAWIALVQRYLSPHPEPVPPRRLLKLLAVPALTLLLIWTNGTHRLVWSYAGPAPDWTTVQRGWAYWAGVVGYANVLLAWGVVQLLQARRSARGADRAQVTLMLLAVVMPTVVNTLYLLGLNVLPGLNPTPVSSALSLLPIAWGMARYGLLHVAPVAHSQVVQHLPDAVFVLDTRGRIVDANVRAADLAGQAHHVLPGRRLHEVLPAWPDEPGGAPVEWRHAGQVWEVQRSTVRDAGGAEIGQTVVARDITARAQEHDRVQQLAHEDALTGLGNRRAFERDLEREQARAARHALPMGLVLLDLNGLKQVNDQLGHASGDALLAAFGQALLSGFRPEDGVYRLGGDEYAVLLADSPPHGESAIWDRMARVVRDVQDRGFPGVSVSVGVAYFPDDGAGEMLISKADARMYAHKRRTTPDPLPLS